MAKYIVVHSVRVCTEFVPETYGRLTTLGPPFTLAYGRCGSRCVNQVCLCECGATGVYRVASLKKQTTVSCGCFRRETTATMATVHSMSATPEYAAWAGMIQRCDNKARNRYSDYGGRGIGYCERWKKFENFFLDMGEKPSPKHTLDRFPNKDGNYEPSNCRWATPEQQNNNRRSNRLIMIGDKTDTLANWCRHYNVSAELVRKRLNRGWEPLSAFTMQSKH